MKDPDAMSPEAAAYLHDLRTLPFEEFRRKHEGSANATLAEARRRARRAKREGKP